MYTPHFSPSSAVSFADRALSRLPLLARRLHITLRGGVQNSINRQLAQHDANTTAISALTALADSSNAAGAATAYEMQPTEVEITDYYNPNADNARNTEADSARHSFAEESTPEGTEEMDEGDE
jgi:hypothetical protein